MYFDSNEVSLWEVRRSTWVLQLHVDSHSFSSALQYYDQVDVLLPTLLEVA